MRNRQLVILLSVVSFLGGCASMRGVARDKTRLHPAPAVLQHPRPAGFWEAGKTAVQVLHYISRVATNEQGQLILDGDGKLTINSVRFIGTGAVLNVNGLVLTNNHVVAKQPIDLSVFPPKMWPAVIPPESYEVCIVTAGLSDCYPAEVVDLYPAHDVARVYTKHHFSHAVKLMDESELEPGDRVYLWGNVFDLLPPSPFFGYYAGLSGPPFYTGLFYSQLLELPVLLMDINVSPGSSGGPAFDTLGRCIGLANGFTSSSMGGRSLGIVIPASTIMKIQKDHPWSPPKKKRNVKRH